MKKLNPRMFKSPKYFVDYNYNGETDMPSSNFLVPNTVAKDSYLDSNGNVFFPIWLIQDYENLIGGTGADKSVNCFYRKDQMIGIYLNDNHIPVIWWGLKTNERTETMRYNQNNACYSSSGFSDKHITSINEPYGRFISTAPESITDYDRTQLVQLLCKLPKINYSRSLTLGSTLLAKLTDEDKKIATDKGWTLA